MGDIAAIETIYKGYKFRSRLEARWAVLFDAAGIRYEYEPDGMKDENGNMYLPDFYLPDYGWYVEVKPNREGAIDEIAKAATVVCGSAKKPLLLLSSIPPGGEIPCWWFPLFYYHQLRDKVMRCYTVLDPIIEDARAEFRVDLFVGYRDEKVFIDTHWYKGTRISIPCAADIYIEPVNDLRLGYMPEYVEDNDGYMHEVTYRWSDRWNEEKLLMSAIYNKARQARFEHGETPKCGGLLK